MFDFKRPGAQSRMPLDYGPATLEMLLNDAIVQRSLEQVDIGEDSYGSGIKNHFADRRRTPWQHYQERIVRPLERVIDSFRFREPNPFHSQLLQTSQAVDELKSGLITESAGRLLEMNDTVLTGDDEGGKTLTVEREIALAAQRRRRAQEEYLLKHPRYDRSLYLFSRENRLRKFCQLVVPAGRGQRTGLPKLCSPHPVVIFELFIDITIVAMVIIMCVATSNYQANTFRDFPEISWNWTSYTTLTFGIIFTIEATIRTIADGLFWAPNTYWLGFLGFIDAVVLVSIWADLIETQVSHEVGGLWALKALRIFRLFYLFTSIRSHIEALLENIFPVLTTIIFAWILLMGFGAYGLALFRGMLDASKTNFDNFGNSTYALFQIMSRRGLGYMMLEAIGIKNSPSSQLYSFYFIAFNLATTIFVLILLLSTFIRNAIESNGQAMMTSDQRSWATLKTLLDDVTPSKSRSRFNHAYSKWQHWFYKTAIRKDGRWYRFITGASIIHFILLCLQIGPKHESWTHTQDCIFLGLVFIQLIDIVIRIIGLDWYRFRQSAWSVYSLVVVSFTIITGIIALCRYKSPYTYIYHLGLDLMAVLIIPRFDRLARAWTTATKSLLPLGNIILAWVSCFIFFAIVFSATLGLAPLPSNATWEMNFRSVPTSLVFLFRLTYGDDWPQLMEDFASAGSSQCLNGSGRCVNTASFQALFTIWNILSMYFFPSACTAIVYAHTSVTSALSTNKELASAVSREDMRRFKQAWQTVDPSGTGYISKEAFPRLLGELSGAFEMSIYDGEFTIRRILEDCQPEMQDYRNLITGGSGIGVDLHKLGEILSRIPVQEIRKRRTKMDLFYNEVLATADPDRGVTFVDVLRILAQYNILQDQRGLRLDETLERRARLRAVERDRSTRKILGFFDTLFWSRRFRMHLNRKRHSRMTEIPQFDRPQIFVEDFEDRDVTTSIPGRVPEIHLPDTEEDENYHPNTPEYIPEGNTSRHVERPGDFLTVNHKWKGSEDGGASNLAHILAHSQSHS